MVHLVLRQLNVSFHMLVYLYKSSKFMKKASKYDLRAHESCASIRAEAVTDEGDGGGVVWQSGDE